MENTKNKNTARKNSVNKFTFCVHMYPLLWWYFFSTFLFTCIQSESFGGGGIGSTIKAVIDHLQIPQDVELIIWSTELSEHEASSFSPSTSTQISLFTPNDGNTAVVANTTWQSLRQKLKSQNTRCIFMTKFSNLSDLFAFAKQVITVNGTQSRKKEYWNPHYFIIVPHTISKQQLQQSLIIECGVRGVCFKLDSDVYIMIFSDNYQRLHGVLEVYSIKNKTIVNEIRFSLQNTHLNFYELTNKLGRRNNLFGTQIAGTAVDDRNFPFDAKFTESNGSYGFDGGASVNMYWYFKDELNFTEKAVKGGWMSQASNGSLIGESYVLIKSGKADLSISQVTILPYRAEKVDFLQPTYLGAGIHAFFQQPRPNTVHDIFVLPFDASVWLTLMSVWVSVVVLLQITVYVQKRRTAYFDISDQSSGENIILWAIGAACQKAWNVRATSSSMKIVLFTGYLLGVMIYTAYCSLIVSILSVQLVTIRSFQDLITNSFTFVVDKDSATLQFLLKNIINSLNLLQEVVTTDSEHVIYKITSSTMAVLYFPDNFYAKAFSYNYTEKFLCEVVTALPVTGVVQDKSGMFVKKGSAFKEIFDHKIMRMKERGLNLRYMKHYDMATSPICTKHTLLRTTPQLSFDDMTTANLILIGGLLLSTFVIIIEKIYSQEMIKKQRK